MCIREVMDVQRLKVELFFAVIIGKKNFGHQLMHMLIHCL
jgi:hypothetical protein